MFPRAAGWRKVVPAEAGDLSRMIHNFDDVVVREVVWWCDREGVEQTTDNVFVGAQVFPEIAPPPLINGERGEDHVVTNKCGEIVYLFHDDVLSPVLAFRAGERCRISA